jgi:hypothetical protein
MAAGTDVDLDVLASLATRLGTSGDDLDAVGGDAPSLPDAGDFTDVLGAMVAHLSEGAGNVVVGLKEAASRIEQTRAGYSAQDAAAAADLRGLF